MSAFLWNRILIPALNVVCRGDTYEMTSPSGNVSIYLCDGWCGVWKFDSHGHRRYGHGMKRLTATMRGAAHTLASGGATKAADELVRLLSTLGAPDGKAEA